MKCRLLSVVLLVAAGTACAQSQGVTKDEVVIGTIQDRCGLA